MVIPKPQGEILLQMPNWAPGSYVLANYAGNVKDLKATDEWGTALPVTSVDASTWKVGATNRSIIVGYSVPTTVGPDSVVHFSGASTYLYVVGRKAEACRLTLDRPSGWRIAVGLDPVRGTTNAFRAKDYDVLADNPVTIGDFLEDTYTVRGRPHILAIRGAARNKLNLVRTVQACRFISEMQTDFFGGAPYNRYVWHFSVFDRPDGAGGLEHLSSTQISLASGVGPRAVGVLSHEFFHLWNVKRIRSKPLGPFDYTQLPQTGALWWLEGVTDYYAHSLLRRYGWDEDQAYFANFLENLTSVRRRPARLEISPYDASLRVREANNGRGNSNGYLVSYYDTGWVLGFLLDSEILYRSKGKHSLDDVTLALWKLTKDDRHGFEEDEIRKQCVRFGGPELGEFYDRVVMKPGELPVEEQLAKLGLHIVREGQFVADLGFTGAASADARGHRVRSVTANGLGPQVKVDDVVKEINGTSLDLGSAGEMTAAFTRALRQLQPRQTISLRIARQVDGAPQDVTVSGAVGEGTREVQRIAELTNASPEAQRLRQLWLARKRR